MKITALKTFLVPPRWLFLKIETDAGISGWGEPVLEGRAETLAALIAEVADFLVGRDPRRINDTWQMLYRNGCYRGGPVLMSAISGIDQALWDIAGKFHGAPVHALLGGAQRERIRGYVWIGGDRPANLVADARAAQAQGFTAVKMNVCEELAIVDSHTAIDAIVLVPPGGEPIWSYRRAVAGALDGCGEPRMLLRGRSDTWRPVLPSRYPAPPADDGAAPDEDALLTRLRGAARTVAADLVARFQKGA